MQPMFYDKRQRHSLNSSSPSSPPASSLFQYGWVYGCPAIMILYSPSGNLNVFETTLNYPSLRSVSGA